jgi:hypothetical protein
MNKENKQTLKTDECEEAPHVTKLKSDHLE